MSRDKYAWGTVTSSLPKTEDKPMGVILLLKKDFYFIKGRIDIEILPGDLQSMGSQRLDTTE